jgi:hypothetical protein
MKKATSSGISVALGRGLAHQDGHAHFQLGRLDGHGQPGVEAAGQPFVDVHQPLGVGVAGHDDVGALGQQGFEGVEELFLGAVLAGEELHVVDQQQVQVVVLGLQFVKGLALVVLDDVADELLGVQVQHAGIRVVLEQGVAHGVHQVRLAQAHAAVDEQRVVHDARRAGHVQRGRAGHLVGAAGHQGVEGQRRVQPVGVGAGRRVAGQRHRLVGFGRHLQRLHGQRGAATPLLRRRAIAGLGVGASLRGSHRKIQPHGLAGQFAEHGFDAARVLRTDPVQLEAVGHAHRHDGSLGFVQQALFGGGTGHQGPDPGVELLFRHFGGEKLATALPQVWAHLWKSSYGSRRKLRPSHTADRSYPHIRGRRQPPPDGPARGASV